MSKLSDFVEYKKHQPEYKEWKENRENRLTKKVSYIKTNAIPNDEYQKDVERAKIVLNAVNVMDEYSQTRAEDMEEVTSSIDMALAQIGIYGGGFLAVLTALITGGKEDLSKIMSFDFKALKNKKSLLKLIPAGLVFAASVTATTILSKFWSAKKQIEASRLGRTEAMTKDLASVNQFAILNEQQQQEADEISKTIKVNKREAKKAVNVNRGFGIFRSLKTILAPDAELTEKQIEFTKKSNEEYSNIQNLKLTKEQELDAKKDKELIQTIVEKIDIASQDYAENAELATSFLSTILLGAGGGTFAIANKILNKLKISAKNSTILSAILGVGITLGGAVACAKVQKQASRVGRFKAKQELLNNPEQLVYVDEEKYKNIDAKATKKSSGNYFKKLIQLFKDNDEYNKYVETNNVKEVQQRKAKDKIKLTKEQELRAKQLQNNVFKMFNKLDEKSQSYAEATEAIGECITELVSFIAMIPTLIITGNMATSGKKPKMHNFLHLALSIIPSLVMQILVTKEQRNASRVANMEAIKDMDDYRHFGSSETISSTTEQQNNASFEAKKSEHKSKSPMLQKMLNKTI